TWSSLATPNNYTTAHIRFNGNFYGGTLAFGETRKNLSVNGISEDIAKIYPNPATTHIVIELRNQEKANAQIFDNLGRVLLTKENITNHTIVDINYLATGIYTLRLELNGKNYFQKIVKQ